MKTIYTVVYEPLNEDIEVLASFSDKKDAQQFGVYYAAHEFKDSTYDEKDWDVVDDFLGYWDIYIYPTKLDGMLNPRVKELTTKISNLRCQLDNLEKEYHNLMDN